MSQRRDVAEDGFETLGVHCISLIIILWCLHAAVDAKNPACEFTRDIKKPTYSGINLRLQYTKLVQDFHQQYPWGGWWVYLQYINEGRLMVEIFVWPKCVGQVVTVALRCHLTLWMHGTRTEGAQINIARLPSSLERMFAFPQGQKWTRVKCMFQQTPLSSQTYTSRSGLFFNHQRKAKNLVAFVPAVSVINRGDIFGEIKN